MLVARRYSRESNIRPRQTIELSAYGERYNRNQYHSRVLVLNGRSIDICGQNQVSDTFIRKSMGTEKSRDQIRPVKRFLDRDDTVIVLMRDNHTF